MLPLGKIEIELIRGHGAVGLLERALDKESLTECYVPKVQLKV